MLILDDARSEGTSVLRCDKLLLQRCISIQMSY